MNATPDGTRAKPDRRIADLERQLAEREAELAEALQRETATAEVLRVINASPGNLTPVFDAILKKAMRLCGAAYGVLRRFDGRHMRMLASQGVPTEYAEFLARNASPPRSEWPPGTDILRALETRQPAQTLDARESVGYRNGAPEARAIADLGGARTILHVPLVKDQHSVGLFTVYRQEVRGFSDKQIALLENFAAQAVIAMENARLLDELRQLTRDLTQSLEFQTSTSDVLKVISRSIIDLQPVLDTMLETATRLCAADLSIMYRRDGDVYRDAAYFGIPSAWREFADEARRQDPNFGEHRPGRGSIVSRIAQEGSVVHVHDVAADPEYERATAIRLGDVRTIVGVPLVREGDIVGAFTLARQRVEPFTERQIELVRTFADQAVIAIENARLITDIREALEHQTATAEVLGVINSSPGDLAPVFDAMLEKATRLCQAEMGAFWTYDGEKMHVAAIRGASPQFAEFLKQGPHRPSPGQQQLLQGEQIVHVVNITEGASYLSGDPLVRAAADLGGVRAILVAPLRKDGAFLGTIGIYRQEVRPFSDKQAALLQNFAAQAVIAMETARLLDELRQRTDQVAELNRGLEARVAEQVEELGRVGRLKRFLAPQLAELIVSQGNEKILESHRREIVVVFCDLRGYTAFTETAEPEEVLDFLREYHGALGPLVSQFEGTLDQFSGDGIMVFFNDPVPIPDPAARAVNMAMAMREAAEVLIAKWRRRGRELGFGAGIAQGYATLGQIGFAERSGYTAIGTVCNLASRLCAEAKDGQILLAQRLAVAVEEIAVLEEIGPLSLKGLSQPVVAYNVPQAATQPALRVIEGGSPRV